ncbi:hypothetical protein ACFLSQ_01020 [Bacteroidota bacterium]
MPNWVMGCAAFITVLLVLWKEYISYWFFELKFEVNNLKVEPSFNKKTNKMDAYVYHIEIVKLKGKGIIKNCRLLLTKIQELKNENWIDIPWNVPRQFVWAPSESDLRLLSFPRRQVVDFAMIKNSENHPDWKPLRFQPQLRDDEFNRVDEIITKNENQIIKRRYHVEIEAENYNSIEPIIFEVTWNGKWSDQPEEMEKYCVIEKI